MENNAFYKISLEPFCIWLMGLTVDEEEALKQAYPDTLVSRYESDWDPDTFSCPEGYENDPATYMHNGRDLRAPFAFPITCMDVDHGILNCQGAGMIFLVNPEMMTEEAEQYLVREYAKQKDADRRQYLLFVRPLREGTRYKGNRRNIKFLSDFEEAKQAVKYILLEMNKAFKDALEFHRKLALAIEILTILYHYKHGISTRDLMAELQHDGRQETYTAKTIQRYIDTLCMAGEPIYSDGGKWKLVNGKSTLLHDIVADLHAEKFLAWYHIDIDTNDDNEYPQIKENIPGE